MRLMTRPNVFALQCFCAWFIVFDDTIVAPVHTVSNESHAK